MRAAALAGCLAAFALLNAPAAQAGWKLNRATAIANIVWGFPCDGDVELKLYSDPVRPDQHGLYRSVEPCAVALNTAPDDWAEFELLCTAAIHEMGHVAGYRDPTTGEPHSSNPRSVMYWRQSFNLVTDVRAGVTRWDGTDRRCRKNGRPYLERHIDRLVRRLLGDDEVPGDDR